MVADLSIADIAAFLWFLFCWTGYAFFADRQPGGLAVAMNGCRKVWAQQIACREARVIDTSIIANLLTTLTFYASTTLFVLGGLVALLGTVDRVIATTSHLPFVQPTTPLAGEIKITLLIVIFIYAFFKFSWAMRLFNYCSILIGGFAAQPQRADPMQDKFAEIANLAGGHFNHGMRGFYFGLAYLGWFIHPVFLAITATLVVGVIYRREFHSRTLSALSQLPYSPSSQ